jgi:hypothetical protein
MAAEKTWRDYARRLSSMSAHEIYTRSRQALSKRADVWFCSTTPDAFDASSKRDRFFGDCRRTEDHRDSAPENAT